MARKYGSTKHFINYGGTNYQITGGLCNIGGIIYNISKGGVNLGTSGLKNITFLQKEIRALFEDAVLVGSAGRNSSSTAYVSLELAVDVFKTPVYIFVCNAGRYLGIYEYRIRSADTVARAGTIKEDTNANIVMSTAVSTGNKVFQYATGSGTAGAVTAVNGVCIFALKFPSYHPAYVEDILKNMSVVNVGGRNGSTAASMYCNDDDPDGRIALVYAGNRVAITYYSKSFGSNISYDVFVSNCDARPTMLWLNTSQERYYINANGQDAVQTFYGCGLWFFEVP